MGNCKPSDTPMAATDRLSKVQGIPLTERIDSLQEYCWCTSVLDDYKTDMSFSVNRVCQYLHAPTNDHWSA